MRIDLLTVRTVGTNFTNHNLEDFSKPPLVARGGHFDGGGDKEKLIEEIFQGAAVAAPYGKFRKRHISCDLSNINR